MYASTTARLRNTATLKILMNIRGHTHNQDSLEH
jgi:uncharacterized protein YfdQ (DUF2303 family)